jgi:hypothetical protein
VLVVPENNGMAFDDAVTEFRRRFSELVDAPADLVFQAHRAGPPDARR